MEEERGGGKQTNHGARGRLRLGLPWGLRLGRLRWMQAHPQPSSSELTGEIGRNEKGQVDEMPTQARENPHRRDQGHRSMDGDEPGGREFSNSRPPPAEGQVHEERAQSNCRQSIHVYNDFSPFLICFFNSLSIEPGIFMLFMNAHFPASSKYIFMRNMASTMPTFTASPSR